MSITYFCTDSQGHTYRRFSMSHPEARFQTAAISRRPGAKGPVRKSQVSYSSGTAKGFVLGDYSYEVVPVRAYQGRHQTEPSA